MQPFGEESNRELMAQGKKLKACVALVFAGLLLCFLASTIFATKGEASGEEEANTAAPIASLPVASSPVASSQAMSRFSHTSSRHAGLKCDSCHTRRADAITPVVPGHRACVGCHVKEFTSTGFNICSNCHEGIKAVRPAVLPFPERQSYGVQFSHVTHATTVEGERRADCSSCHAVAGARATLPAHKECYACHKAPDQFKPGETVIDGSCGVCHTSAGSRKAFSAGGPAYRYRFSHAVHVQRVSRCNDCHKVLGEGADQVSQPRLSEHRSAGFAQSCGGCHNGRRAFGGEITDNACARCHGRPMM